MGHTHSPLAGERAPFVVDSKLKVASPGPQTITRDRLHGVIDAALERPLTVLSAPAGYGKTTALADWLAVRRHRCAWVTLDAGDNDPRRLLSHVLAAVDGVLPGAMDEPRAALGGRADVRGGVIGLAGNALAEHADDSVLVVLDDYDSIEDRRCHEVVIGLLGAGVPALRLIVASRTPPPLRLARRRAEGSVTEVGVTELRFDAAETEDLLNRSLGLGLDRRGLELVDACADGWPAGLALIGSSLRDAEPRDGARLGDALAVSRAKVAEYLAEEVLDRIDPRLREFLRRTAILDRLSGPLCEAVLDDPEASVLLAEARRSNLFLMPIDAEREWLRYHPMFADAVGRELRDVLPEPAADLHRRASRWFERAGCVDDAVAHASAAGDGARAAELLHERWIGLVNERRYAEVRRLIAGMPVERGDLAGFCEALDVLCASLERGDMARTYERLQALERRRDEPGVAPIVDRMRISPFYGRVSEAVRAGWQAWERYPEPHELRLRIAAQLAAVLWFAGDRTRVRELLEPRLAQLEGFTTTRAWALATLALTALDDGETDAAERYGRDALAVVVACGGESAIEFAPVYAAYGAALTARGDLDGADRQLAHAAGVTGTLPGSVAHALTLIFQARLDLARHVHQRARAHAAQARRILDRHVDVGTLASRLADVEAVLVRRSGSSLLGSEPTPAELRVLALLPEGPTVAEIAAALHLSSNTIRSHIRRLYRRLGAGTRSDAVRIARERDLL